MYKHFIFDIDGTLIDTEFTGVQSLVDTVRQLMDRDIPYAEAYKYYGIPSGKVGGMLGYEDTGWFGEIWEENFIRLSHLIKPFDGVAEVLSAIKKAGRTIGCVTSRNRFEFNKDIHLQALVSYFDHVVCAEDSIQHKPSPEPMFAYMKKAEAASGAIPQPSECIFIGDTMHDWQCGHGAGCDFALADWQHRGLQGIPAEYHFQRTEEILTLLNH
ncbi:MAG: HAD-IA family hydrolase [Bacteroidia bacterium]|nr:HAD-IA family hydrolase [Bacteroidia bacterium]